MKTYMMQDRSGGKVNREDKGLNITQVLYMTDYTNEEIEAIMDLRIGEELFIGEEKDTYIKRTENL